MNQREIELLEKKSLHSFRVNPDIKDQVASGYLNELSRIVKKEIKRKELTVLVIEDSVRSKSPKKYP